MKMKERGENFIIPDNSPNNIKRETYRNQAAELAVVQEMEEKSRQTFITDRTESDGEIQEAHSISFLKKVIPEMLACLAKNGEKRKLKILDLGGGLGLFAEEIRENFGDQVKIFTNSAFGESDKKRQKLLEIKKQTHSKNSSLHKLEAYKASILNFRDFPEFDLIIDTYGEIFYANNKRMNPDAGEQNFLKKLTAIIKKLNSGGKFYFGKMGEKTFNRLWAMDQNQIDNQKIKITFGGFTKQEIINQLKSWGLNSDDWNNHPPTDQILMDYLIDLSEEGLDGTPDSSPTKQIFGSLLKKKSVCIEKI